MRRHSRLHGRRPAAAAHISASRHAWRGSVRPSSRCPRARFLRPRACPAHSRDRAPPASPSRRRPPVPAHRPGARTYSQRTAALRSRYSRMPARVRALLRGSDDSAPCDRSLSPLRSIRASTVARAPETSRCRGMREPDRFRAGLVGRYCRRLGRRCGEEGARGLDSTFERLDIGIIMRAGTNG